MQEGEQFEYRARKEHAFAVSPFTVKERQPDALLSLTRTLKQYRTYVRCVHGAMECCAVDLVL